MKGTILILMIFGVLVYGYVLMGKLDKFLNENREVIKTEQEKKEPTRVFLMEKYSEKELLEEIRRFRQTHDDIYIVLCDNTNTALVKQDADRYSG